MRNPFRLLFLPRNYLLFLKYLKFSKQIMGRAFEYRRASKEKRWDKMSKLFPKLAKNITIAAKEGGADPDLNAKLRTAILNAKSQNMPKDNIDAAIKRAAGKDSENFAEISYEGKGPHGVLVFVECATDNNTRQLPILKPILINMEEVLFLQDL